MIGKTLGHYQITSQLGKGGMGEVFQAKDQILGRDVAIKVLPEEFAKDADRVSRFQREAKLLASLNHPNIAAIYGLEESSGTNFLVLELVEGDTLADRIKDGLIPVEESLKLALQIAEALEAAHEKGVIHRDLKPANIKVTPDGKVKVLDFGLAKAFTGEQADLNLSNSPTLSNAATQQGVILGTAAYMSPEQARGKSVDKRTDIWAFGCVLFEMLTGRVVFSGKDVTDILAAVIRAEPEWTSLPVNLHGRLREVMERCLQKDAKDRYHDISDVKADIQRVLTDPSGVFVPPVAEVEPRGRLRIILPWATATLVLGLIIAGVAVWKLNPPDPRPVMRFTYELPEGQQLISNVDVAVSSDGSQFAYSTIEGLYLRSMGALDARLIAGSDKGSHTPFFSPDGQWIGYVSGSDQKLKKISINGGVPIVICEASSWINGASWSTDNTIVFADMFKGIMRVYADGGTPELVIKGDIANIGKEGIPIYPQLLPDGKNLLYVRTFDRVVGNSQTEIQSLKSGERKVLYKKGGTYLPSGHLMHGVLNDKIANSYNFYVVPFDLDRLEITGGSVPVLEGIGGWAFSNSGTLIYVPQPGNAAESKGAASAGSTLVWVDRHGKEEPLAAAPDSYATVKISPDGARVALTADVSGGKSDIWIWDVVRENMSRLTLNEGGRTPLWTHDGKLIVYFSSGVGSELFGLYRRAADGTGKIEKLSSATDRLLTPCSWSNNGKALVLNAFILAADQADIGMLSTEGNHALTPLLQEKYNEAFPQISPDGQWMAYISDESGKYEVYVRSFPDVNKGRWQISTAGGDSPLWSPDGRELFYHSGDSYMAVAVETAPTFKPGNPKLLFKGTYISKPKLMEGTVWDISSDGKRFLMIKPPAATGTTPAPAGPRTKINIVLNWFEELKQRVPVK